jgi:Putative Ig domain
MSYPQWITPGNLGIFAQDYSFDVNPIVLEYFASTNAAITQINGQLPAGLRLDQTNSTVKLLGVCIASASDIKSQFTLRITNSDGVIADRTFNITLTSVPQAPSWANQSTFLGYESNVLPQAFTLTATVSEHEHVVYSILSTTVSPPVPIQSTINPQSGVLICDANNVVVNNSTITVSVRASTSTFSDITCTIEVITEPDAPEWITPAGTLGTFADNDFLQINLLAKDVKNEEVKYTLVSNSNNASIEVATDGLLYGRLTSVLSETLYTFTVSATNSEAKTSYRTFDIIVVPNQSLSLLEWLSDSNLGTINDGTYVEIPLTAVSKRNSTIVYNLTGGILPPNLTVSKTQGSITGFCEYHGQSKIYNFDISAYDGYQTIVKQFQLTVKKVYNDIFFGVDIPLMGNEKGQWIADGNQLNVREPGTTVYDTIISLDTPPRMNLIRGLETGYADKEKIYGFIAPWAHNLSLQFGPAGNTSVSGSNSFLFRDVIDSQYGSNALVFSSSVYNTNVQTSGLVEPISLENIRTALTDNFNFVNSGGGTDLVISPVLDWSTGALSAVSVLNPGKDYVSPPTINITGSGQGATVRAQLGVISINLVDFGRNWQVGDIITVQTGEYLLAAQITILAVTEQGSIISYNIDNPGDYLQIPSLDTFVFEKNSYTSVTFQISWGIPSVLVLEGGSNYQNNISLNVNGNEILPLWQNTWFPAVGIGNINAVSGSTAASKLNLAGSLYGNTWTPNYFVLYWEGIIWLGKTSFDDDLTTFDGNDTRLEETESAYETIFDSKMTYFDNYYTEFDYKDPLAFNIPLIYGSTIFDSLLTTTEFYATRYDQGPGYKRSQTVYPVLLRVNNQTYGGNNAVY